MNSYDEYLKYIRFYDGKDPALLSGYKIGDVAAELAAAEAAYKAVVELGKWELIPDIAQDLLIEIMVAESNGNPIRTKKILQTRAKGKLAEMTEQVNPAFHVMPEEIPGSLVRNMPEVVRNSLPDLNDKQRQYFETQLDGTDEEQANLSAWPAKPGANALSEQNRIRRNRSDANTALAKAANRRASKGMFASYETFRDDVYEGSIADTVQAQVYVGPRGDAKEAGVAEELLYDWFNGRPVEDPQFHEVMKSLDSTEVHVLRAMFNTGISMAWKVAAKEDSEAALKKFKGLYSVVKVPARGLLQSA